MWGGSAQAHAHCKYFYRSAFLTELLCKISSQYWLCVFTLFLTERWSLLPGLMVQRLPHWTSAFTPSQSWVFSPRWGGPEPPKRQSWHELKSSWVFNLTNLWHWNLAGRFDHSRSRKCCCFFSVTLILNDHDIMYSTYSDTRGRRSQERAMFALGHAVSCWLSGAKRT